MGELTMFPTEVLAAYLLAALIVVVAPGPDNILAISRGLGQGRSAAAMSSLGAGLGIMVHTIAATLGVAVVLQTSPLAFWVVKAVGAAYLLCYGAIFAVLTTDVFTLFGCFSARLSGWLARKPRVAAAENVGAGLTFVAAGLSILALD